MGTLPVIENSQVQACTLFSYFVSGFSPQKIVRHGQVIHEVISRDVTKLGNIWADFNEAMVAADPIRITIIYFTNRKFRASICSRELLDPAESGSRRAVWRVRGDPGRTHRLLECAERVFSTLVVSGRGRASRRGGSDTRTLKGVGRVPHRAHQETSDANVPQTRTSITLLAARMRIVLLSGWQCGFTDKCRAVDSTGSRRLRFR
jgi:hypothetical protein